jgi:hypothetical protein
MDIENDLSGAWIWKRRGARLAERDVSLASNNAMLKYHVRREFFGFRAWIII